MNRTLKFLSNLSSLLSIIGFFISISVIQQQNFKAWQIILVILSVLGLLALLILEHFSGPKKYKSEQQINDYMRNWIKRPGRTVIFTRDMSWVNNSEIENELRKKARKNELIICQPNGTKLTESLKEEGAELYTYSSLNYTPKSRFTFINYGSNSSKVAIGKKDNKHNHIISEFTTSDTIEYFLAEDLVNLVKKLDDNGYSRRME